LIAAIATVFASTYAFASARTASTTEGGAYASDAYYGAAYGDAGEAAGSCACCDGGSAEEVVGVTTLDGDVQYIDVGIGQGYEPNVIQAQAGVPIEITFAQGSGCYAEVYFPDFNVFEDLTQGPVTISLPALDAGEYWWSCGMQMVFGKVVVE
jgi:hypothetical protein